MNCTGPAPVGTPGWNPLVDNLAVNGHALARAVRARGGRRQRGALLDADGVAARGMYAVGAARRGVDWEVAAVPDIRRQAVRLARHLGDPAPQPVELVG